jgi:hypothetical protein
VVFNCSPEDARVLARHTVPELDEHDLSHLDRYVAAARLVVNGAETAAFTLHTNPPPKPVGEARRIRDRCAELTRQKLPTITPATNPAEQTGTSRRRTATTGSSRQNGQEAPDGGTDERRNSRRRG